MAILSVASRAALLASLAAAGFALSGCATEDYVNKHIAEVNGRIDQTNAHMLAIDRRVGEVETVAHEGVRRADAAQASANAANATAQQAAQAAQAASSEAARANDDVARLKPQVAHLMRHHKYKTWSDTNKKKKKKPKKAKAGERG